MEGFSTLFHSAIIFGTVILFGSLGEILTEKTGNLNLGVPGTMYLGAIAGLASGLYYQRACEAAGRAPSQIILILLPFICAFAAGAFGGLIYSFLTTTLRANQNVTGLALTTFGSGVANFFGGSMGGVGQVNASAASEIYRTPVFSFLPVPDTVKSFFFDYGFMVYLAIIIGVMLWFFFAKTNTGLNLRAIGENPATADAVGVNVTRYKYVATCMGTGITGLGGLYYVMDLSKGLWANDGYVENLGWLAVALVIFATWKPLRSIWGSYLFGILFWAYMLLAEYLTRRSQELLKMLPYVVTIIVLVIGSLRKKKENQPPEALGLAYFREDR